MKTKRLLVVLRREDFDALAKLAGAEWREPEQEAAYLLRLALAERQRDVEPAEART